MPLQKLAHAELKVDDVDQALGFHIETLGLTELARDNGTVFLGCGVDDNYDLALTAGGSGVAHFALEVTSDGDLEAYGERLTDMGIEVESRDGGEPGQKKSIRFTAPSGHVIELVTLEQRQCYLHPGSARQTRRGVAPLDVDHITLLTPDVKGLVDFLTEALDFKVSDVFSPAPGVWAAAWTRVGEHHHDVAMLGGPDLPPHLSLHHLAFGMTSMDHIKQGADALAQANFPLEVGPGRHGIGANLFAYFYAPGGNRYELTAEMARAADPKVEPNMWSELFPKGFSAWGQAPPESFQGGS